MNVEVKALIAENEELWHSALNNVESEQNNLSFRYISITWSGACNLL